MGYFWGISKLSGICGKRVTPGRTSYMSMGGSFESGGGGSWCVMYCVPCQSEQLCLRRLYHSFKVSQSVSQSQSQSGHPKKR